MAHMEKSIKIFQQPETETLEKGLYVHLRIFLSGVPFLSFLSIKPVSNSEIKMEIHISKSPLIPRQQKTSDECFTYVEQQKKVE